MYSMTVYVLQFNLFSYNFIVCWAAEYKRQKLDLYAIARNLFDTIFTHIYTFKKKKPK